MREPHFPLSKVADKNNDVMIKVPWPLHPVILHALSTGQGSSFGLL